MKKTICILAAAALLAAAVMPVANARHIEEECVDVPNSRVREICVYGGPGCHGYEPWCGVDSRVLSLMDHVAVLA